MPLTVTVLLVHTEPRDVSRPWGFSSISCSPHHQLFSLHHTQPTSTLTHSCQPVVPEVHHHCSSLRQMSKKQAKSKRKKNSCFSAESPSRPLIALSPSAERFCKRLAAVPQFSSPQPFRSTPWNCPSHQSPPCDSAQRSDLCLPFPEPGTIPDPSVNSASPEPGFFSLCSHPAIFSLCCTALTFPLDRAMLLWQFLLHTLTIAGS